jgi:hypothetical protein
MHNPVLRLNFMCGLLVFVLSSGLLQAQSAAPVV